MKKPVVMIFTAVLIFIFSVSGIGCNKHENNSGANIRIEDVSLGGLGIEGRPISGLPSDRISLLLDVSADEIQIGYDGDKVKLTVNPSQATIEIRDGGISIKGIEPEQLRIEWGASK
ncbi:MAG: hypothetical protein PHI12_12060 [Dehalococcoidales bacterium]|nr:hypothetical protein [Dehalococcoidales bacterium]